jgi:23S rRNA pseudouridine2457 synthase
MTAAVGFPTLRLVRVRVGNVHLNQMKSGEVVEITDLLEKVLS